MASFLEDNAPDILTGGLKTGLGSAQDIISGGAYGDAKNTAQQGIDAFGNIKLPTADELHLQLTQLVNNGNMTPAQAQAIMQDPSAMNGITLDPKLKQAQMEALASLQDIGQNKGLTDMDKAQLSQIQGQEQTAARGAREAILQNAQQRGMGGSGLEMLSQMQNAQDSATRQSARDTSVAGMAQQRALQALQGAGTLGGQIGAQQFGQQADIAKANDTINQFNAANKNQAAMYNTQAANQAQQFNLQKEMDVNKLNNATQNQQAAYNANVPQELAKNDLAKAGGIAGAGQTAVQTDIEKGKANTGIFGSALQAGGAAAGSDRNLKKDIKDFDASAFLDSLTPSKYHYKNPEKWGKGEHAGIMAQDLEKTPEGKALVENTDQGKIVDYGKGLGTMLAAMADIHKRLKKIEGS